MQDIKYGRVVHRREDARLTQGKGLYAGDVSLDRMTHAPVLEDFLTAVAYERL